MKGQKLEQATIARMRGMRAAGMKVKDIAAEIGCSEALVSLRTKNVSGIQKQTRKPVADKRWKDRELRARWREIQASAQDILFARQWGNQWEKGMRPCEHCRWHMNGDPVIVCLRYCDLWGV